MREKIGEVVGALEAAEVSADFVDAGALDAVTRVQM